MIVEPIPAAVLPLAEQHGAGVPLKFGEGSQEPEPAPVLTAALSDHLPGPKVLEADPRGRILAYIGPLLRSVPLRRPSGPLRRDDAGLPGPPGPGQPMPPEALELRLRQLRFLTQRGRTAASRQVDTIPSTQERSTLAGCGSLAVPLSQAWFIGTAMQGAMETETQRITVAVTSHTQRSHQRLKAYVGPSMAGSDLTMPPGELIQNLGGANCEPSSGRATTKWRSSAPAKLALPVWRCGKYREMEVTNSFAPSIPQRRLKRSTGWLT